MISHRAQRGTALLAALMIVLIVLPVSAFVVFQARTDWQIEHNLHAAIEAFYVAEAGLAHAIDDIGPRVSYEALLDGPDRIPGTSDDGVFPFPEGAPAVFPHAPLHYDVRVESAGNGLLRLVSTAAGAQQAIKVVEALVTRAALPFTPGAVYVAGDTSTFDLGNAGFQISGTDPSPLTSDVRSLPALAVSGADVESDLRRQLAPASGGQLSGAGSAPSIATVSAFDLGPFAATCESAATTLHVPAGSCNGDVVLGSAGMPQLSIVDGDLTVDGHLDGTGVLVIQGTLQVTGQLTFNGVVMVAGAVICAPASEVTVHGALWRAATQDGRLLFRGHGGITYSSSALAAVDTAFPDLFPHLPKVVGWQEPL